MLEIVKLAPREGGTSCSHALPGSHFAGYRPNLLCRTSYQNIFHRYQIFFFNLDNPEPATGYPAPEKEVKELKLVNLDVFEQAPGCPN